MKTHKPIRILVANTAFIMRKGLRTLIEETENFIFVGEAEDKASLEVLLSRELANVLVIEHCCEDCFSVDTIQKVKNENPDLNLLVISHEKSAEQIRKIIQTGIQNYLLNDCSEQEITDAIVACAKNQKYFCGQIIDVLLEKELSPDEHCMTGSISDREAEVILKLVSGKRPKEIAELMNLSYHTIVTHKRNIYSKLGISNAIELAQYAIKTGLIK
ncbi:hypothetical protein CNR22_00250 [Sphingobacteriaceae bacterium]|nr:hypothetical protein CNR22_00250 [Sphingobacteriaceae bacterium]